MLATLVIVFRETIEAGLIVGVVLAATQGVPGRRLQIGLGVLAGLAGACLVALFAGSISQAFQGGGQELFNAAILMLAVVMLAWHTIWMARHGRSMAAELRGVGEAVRGGRRPLSALSVVVGVAVLREGAEVVLFLYGIAVGGGSGWTEMLTGGLLGVALGVLLSVVTHAGLVRLPARALFATIFWLVTLLAAGMAAQAALFLQTGGVINVLFGTVWDSSAILSDTSLPGRLLHTLIGYNDHPTQLQVLAYLATLVGITGLARWLAPAPAPRRVARQG